MESLDDKIQGKLKALKFTLSKTDDIVMKGNITAIERHRDALKRMVSGIQILKQESEEAQFTKGESEKNVEIWAKHIEDEIEKVDAKVTFLTEKLFNLNLDKKAQQQEKETMLTNQARQAQLAFEQQQLQIKLDYEEKLGGVKKSAITSSTEKAGSSSNVAKLPKLVISKFNGTHQDWLRFWNQFEAAIDKSEVAPVTKFSYLKELVEPKVRNSIDGLPFSTEGYERAKTILKAKYGKPSEIVNSYVKNIMALPVISDASPGKIHNFYEKLLFNVQALETLGKLKEINGYVRMSLDKLEGIRGDLVRTDDDWREWDFPKFVDALRKWTERNPVQLTSKDNRKRHEPTFHTQQRTCVYCEKPDHKSFECSSVSKPAERRQILQRKRLCFNCTGSGHRASECKSRSKCRVCDARHHSSICEKPPKDNLMTTNQGNEQQVVYPVVVVNVNGVKCRALLDSGSGSSYASSALLEKIGTKPFRSGIRQVEMMLTTATRRMELYNVNVSSVNKTFAMDINVTKVEKPQLIMLKNPSYKNLLQRNQHLNGVVMDDVDEKPDLPVHLILGISECTRISTAEPPRVGGEWDPVAVLTKLGWTITSPGQEFDLTAMLATQTTHVDYEELCKLDVLGLADRPVGDQGEVFVEFKEQLQRSQDG